MHYVNFCLILLFSGLSKEGWFITKNLVTELAILLVGFFTFVPAIQVIYILNTVWVGVGGCTHTHIK